MEFAEAETDLASLLMRPISQFFATEQVFEDHDLADARQGAGFLAVLCATDGLKDPRGPLSNRKILSTDDIIRPWGSNISRVI